MIKTEKALTYSEVVKLIGDGEKAQKIKDFVKEFYRLNEKESSELKKELESLDLIKLKEQSIVNIVNFLPKDASDVMKILPDVSLDQEEINKILEVVKKY